MKVSTPNITVTILHRSEPSCKFNQDRALKQTTGWSIVTRLYFLSSPSQADGYLITCNGSISTWNMNLSLFPPQNTNQTLLLHFHSVFTVPSNPCGIWFTCRIQICQLRPKITTSPAENICWASDLQPASLHCTQRGSDRKRARDECGRRTTAAWLQTLLCVIYYQRIYGKTTWNWCDEEGMCTNQ